MKSISHLLEDFGDNLMLGALNESSADALYHGALDELVAIQQVRATAEYLLPPYNSELLDREMALFPDWLLETKLALHLNAVETQALAEYLDERLGQRDSHQTPTATAPHRLRPTAVRPPPRRTA